MSYRADPDVAVVLAGALAGHRMTRSEARGAARMFRALVDATESLHLGDEPLRARLIDAAEMLERQAAAPRRR